MRIALLAPLLLTGCAAAYMQSEFAAGVDPATVGAELLPRHAPLLLVVGESGGAPPAMLQRFHDTLARELEAAGYTLTRDPDAAGSRLVLGYSTEARERTEWRGYATGGRVYYGVDGHVTHISPGYYYSRPYTVRTTWLSFSASLYFGDAAAPVWTGFASMKGDQPSRTIEASARELLQMLLGGEQEPLDYRILD